MFKKLLKAVKIIKTAKEIKNTVDNIKQPEFNPEDKIREAVKDYYKPTEQAQTVTGKFSFEDILKNHVTNMKTKNLENICVESFVSTENTPDMLKTAIKEARFFANLSSCQKAKVGCAIFDDEHILSIGYNTNKSYHFSCDGSECQVAGKNNSTNCGIVHAEVVAVENLQLSEHCGNQKYAYVTNFPCTQCLYQLQKEGIKEVFYTCENYFTKDLVRMNPDITFTQV